MSRKNRQAKEIVEAILTILSELVIAYRCRVRRAPWGMLLVVGVIITIAVYSASNDSAWEVFFRWVVIVVFCAIFCTIYHVCYGRPLKRRNDELEATVSVLQGRIAYMRRIYESAWSVESEKVYDFELLPLQESVIQPPLDWLSRLRTAWFS